MSKNGTVEEAVAAVPAAKGAEALGLIERRLEALQAQRQRGAATMEHLRQKLQALATEDAACQGAIATLQALREEIAGTVEVEDVEKEGVSDG